MPGRNPRSYIGTNHKTIGSDVLAVLKALHLPERALGAQRVATLQAVKPDEWYPIAMLTEALECIDQSLGTFAVRSVGWQLFKLSHADQVKTNIHSARQLLEGFDDVYRRANRGTDIGGWKVLQFDRGIATLEKTTPHHCVVEEGILEEALRTIGVRATVGQRQCFRKGADCCIFVITSDVTDARWFG